MAAKRRWVTRKPNLPVICFTIHDDHAFFYKRNNERGEAIQRISQMALRTSLQSFPACKIDICGEEEREQVPTFENWKELDVQVLYERCAVQHGTKRKRESKVNFRRQPSEYFFTYDIDCILERLQNTRADKVRELRKEAMELAEEGGKSLEQVLEDIPSLAYNEDEFLEFAPVRFEIRTTRCSQNPSRVKH